MSHSLTRQLLWPAIGLILFAVAVNVAFAAWLAADRVRRNELDRQRQVADLLAESTFPFTANVLEQLRRLTGKELAVVSKATAAVLVETRPGLLSEMGGSSVVLSRPGEFETEAWLVLRRDLRMSPEQAIVLLSSRAEVRAALQTAIMPPLLVGAATVALLGPLVGWIVRRFVLQLRRIEQRCGEIAAGDFGSQLEPLGRGDEITQLTTSVNNMSRQLRTYRDELTRTERTRLLAQVAAGFAHQLRNGLAGARLAVQVHRTRCVPRSGDDSLDQTLRQLDLMGEEVRSLLSLGKQSSDPPVPVDLNAVTAEIEQLVSPMCAHRGVTLVREDRKTPPLMGSVERIRGAILNLALNAIDAIPTGGRVELTLCQRGGHATVVVRDNGKGPSSDVTESLFEPFVTTKPEGVGLGLTMAATVAREHGGSLTWRRDGYDTLFELELAGMPEPGP